MTRQRILDAAFVRFAHSGYEGTTLADIAGDVGIKTPSLYAHFAGKDAIFAAVYERSLDAQSAFVDELLAEAVELGPLARLRALLFGVRDYYLADPRMLEFDLRNAVVRPGVISAQLAERFERWELRVTGAVRDAYIAGRDAGDFTSLDPDAFATAFSSLMDGVFLQVSRYDPTDIDERFTQVWAFVEAALTRSKDSR